MIVQLGGVIPILPTPFTAAGEIDEDGFDRTVEASISDHVDGLALFGLASEYYKLSDAERARLVGQLVRRAAGRVPVVVSIVSHASKLAVAEAVRAVEAGADALMIMPPFFLAPPINAIVQHVRAIAAVVPAPLIVQYAPLQTGRTIDTQVFRSLHQEVPNFTHVKVDLVPSGRTVAALHSCGLRTLVGYMGLHLPEDFLRGADGVMPTVSLGSAFVRLWRLLAKEDENSNECRAQNLHHDLLPLLNFMMQSIEQLIVCEKHLLVHRGILDHVYFREPAYHLDATETAELEAHQLRLASCLKRYERQTSTNTSYD